MKNPINYLLTLFILLYSCSGSDATTQLPDEDPEYHTIQGWVGEKFSVGIFSPSDSYHIEVKNPDIATGIVSDKGMVQINTVSPGSTHIQVYNSADKVIALISIDVVYFGGKNIEEIDMHPTEKSNVTVDALDQNVKSIIEDELWTEIAFRKSTKYTFDVNTNQFTMYIPQSDKNYQGKYKWTLDSLTLIYDDVIEEYGFEIAIGRVCYLLKTDKTPYYQSLYPEAGITNVSQVRLLYDYDRVGIPGGGGLTSN